MAIVSREPKRGPVEIDLSGPDGNVFALMGYASRQEVEAMPEFDGW